MDRVTIEGKRQLFGETELPSAKNAVLPLIAATIISESDVIIKNCQPLSDVKKMIKIIGYLGGNARFEGGDLVVNCKCAEEKTVGEKYTGE
ncbi:MAG: UDP-N-acetylglucosamine 1-carboxyvinyltransferase, partial [Candidatus Neoclostridium sp.]